MLLLMATSAFGLDARVLNSVICIFSVLSSCRGHVDHFLSPAENISADTGKQTDDCFVMRPQSSVGAQYKCLSYIYSYFLACTLNRGSEF